MQDRDEAVERVLAIDVIHLLSAEGAHSDEVNAQLASSEVWQAFSQQRHDLFLPAAANPQVNTIFLGGHPGGAGKCFAA